MFIPIVEHFQKEKKKHYVLLSILSHDKCTPSLKPPSCQSCPISLSVRLSDGARAVMLSGWSPVFSRMPGYLLGSTLIKGPGCSSTRVCSVAVMTALGEIEKLTEVPVVSLGTHVHPFISSFLIYCMLHVCQILSSCQDKTMNKTKIPVLGELLLSKEDVCNGL